ncbi:MAG: condensation domain-containing protein, partial [Bacteroidota bacterium]|nr:condensation domain-containing protein [Bacteroidota bacterium]
LKGIQVKIDSSRNREYVCATNSLEEELIAIWSELLSVDKISITDNFFELGGDSILGIQFISKARRKGIKITPLQLFQNQTIKKLALVAQVSLQEDYEQGLITGQSPLTPIQNWFFEQEYENMDYWNQSLLIEIKEHINYPEIKTIIETLLNHHDALRSRFILKEGKYQQLFNPALEEIPLEYVDISQLKFDEKKRAIEYEASQIQMGLNIEKGPLIKFAYFNMGHGNNDRIMIAVHHLAIDAVSWQILRGDLLLLYKQLKEKKELKLPSKTTSYKKWSEELSEYAQYEQIKSQMDFWLNRPFGKISNLIKDMESSDFRERNYSVVNTELDEENTDLLQKQLAQSGFGIMDVMLTALLMSFSRWTGKRSLLLELESHGREPFNDKIDISRTIGWFTSVYPLLLDMGKAITTIDILNLVKEQYGSIPLHGIGFGLLKYLSSESEIREKFHRIPQPEISFNYMGQNITQTQKGQESILSEAKENKSSDRSLSNRALHLIDINGAIYNDKLRLEWSYNSKMFFTDTIKQLGENFLAELKKIISELNTKDASKSTSLAFQPSGVKKEDLNKIIGRFKK